MLFSLRARKRKAGLLSHKPALMDQQFTGY